MKKIEDKLVWSEEDENMWLSVIEYVQTYPAHRNSVVNWLKSLKDRYTWKPGGEQLNALEIVSSAKGFYDK